MNLKEFFRPSWWKVMMTVLMYIFLLFILMICVPFFSVAESYKGQSKICPSIIYSLMGFLGEHPFSFLLEAVLLYILTCFIILIFKRIIK